MTSPEAKPTVVEKLEWAVWPSFAMLAGIQLDLFTALKDGPQTAEQIARSIGVKADKLKPLLYALAAVELLTVQRELFANSDEASRFLVRGNPAYRGGKHEVLLHNWSAGLKTADSIRTATPQSRLEFLSASQEALEKFYRSNHAQAMRRGRELMASYDLSSHHTLLDVGGGSGGLAIAVTEAFTHIRATVVDLSVVTSITDRIVKESGASDRVQVMAADVISDKLAGSYDAAVLSSFIQVISSDKARRAIKNIGDAVNDGGAIYIRGDVVDDSGTSPLGAVMRNLVYLNVYDEGQAYTMKEHTQWLEEAGFTGVERKILPDGFSMLRARKRH